MFILKLKSKLSLSYLLSNKNDLLSNKRMEKKIFESSFAHQNFISFYFIWRYYSQIFFISKIKEPNDAYTFLFQKRWHSEYSFMSFAVKKLSEIQSLKKIKEKFKLLIQLIIFLFSVFHFDIWETTNIINIFPLLVILPKLFFNILFISAILSSKDIEIFSKFQNNGWRWLIFFYIFLTIFKLLIFGK